MSFGHVPNKTTWKDLILKIMGYPNLIRRLQARVIMRMLELRGTEYVLDVGCGGGYFTFEIAKRCKLSIGVDLVINENCSFIMSKQRNLDFIKGDVQSLPFIQKKFDKILLSSVLQMVESDTTLLKECYRVARENGFIVISVPVGYLFLRKLNNLKPHLKKLFGALGRGYYNPKEIISLLKSEGFKVVEMEYSPKKWGSFIFEIGLYLWIRYKFPFFSPLLFPFLYFIAYVDKFADRKQIGNELIIKAAKVLE